jgi:Family of unknown function (DUF6206)
MMDLMEPPLPVDRAFLKRFEAGLDPQHPETSRIPARILGYGEISSIFAIEGMPSLACKRMPIFSTVPEAESYAAMFHTYSRHLVDAGLTLPRQATSVVPSAGGGVVLYIVQRQLPDQNFGHHLIHAAHRDDVLSMIRDIVVLIDGVWAFNAARKPQLELALDGQLSNWVRSTQAASHEMLYIDTSTPLFRIDGREQLDSEKLLKSAPGALRWILRRFFLEDVMNRYYSHRDVVVDLVANLYKEQRPDLIAPVVEAINRCSVVLDRPIQPEAVDRYYRSDRIIWTLFLAFRRMDRWMSRNLLRRRYEFILPGPIKR